MAAIRVGFGEGIQPAFSNGLPDVVFQSAPPAKGAMRFTIRKGVKIQFQSAPPAKGAMRGHSKIA